MNKFVQALLLPALTLARGKNDGTDQENAITTVLLDNDKYVLTLHSYNSKPLDIPEFHGDTNLQIKAGSESPSFQEFGWCIKFAEDIDKWDCMVVRTQLVPSQIENDIFYESEFQIFDGGYDGADPIDQQAYVDIVLDDDFKSDEDPEKSWKKIAVKSTKDCELDPEWDAAQPDDEFNFKFVSCDSVNSHFFRNFVTDNTQDNIQFDMNQLPVQEYTIRGYVREHGGPEFDMGWGYTWGEAMQFTPVSAAFQ